jgi:hypothetical protein
MRSRASHRMTCVTLILSSAYNANEHPARTMDLFNEMRDVAKIKPNNVSYLLYFQACVMLKSFDQAKAMHEELKQKVSTFMKNKVRSLRPCTMILSVHFCLGIVQSDHRAVHRIRRLRRRTGNLPTSERTECAELRGIDEPFQWREELGAYDKAVRSNESATEDST